jgi:uridine phosphorylase
MLDEILPLNKNPDPTKFEDANTFWNREYRLITGVLENEKVSVCSTGIGDASTSILIDELAQLGCKTFIRIGTCGGISDEIEIGDVIISEASIRMEGASLHYAPVEYPASADLYVTLALDLAGKKIAKKEGFKCIRGLTVSTATFYPGQGRKDSAQQYPISQMQGMLEEWQRLGAKNIEMESSTLFTLARVFRVRAGCVSVVIGKHKDICRIPNHQIVKKLETRAIQIGIQGMRFLIQWDKTPPSF